MALRESQQIFETLKGAKRPLIVIPRSGGADGYATALGLKQIFNKFGTSADIVAADGRTPKSLHFLPEHEQVREGLLNIRKLVVELDVNDTKLDELSYNIEDGILNIHLSPRQGFWKREDVRARHSSYRYDLIVSLGAQDYASHGDLFHEHSDFFYRTPVINIDHSPANEHFGNINHVDITATACAEVLHDLIVHAEDDLIDEHVATCLLAGMIAKTKSFKTPNVTPKTLETAGRLMQRGANREEIVLNLYRTRSVETLRLWGRALARLKSDKHAGIVWTVLSQQDFMLAGAMEEDLSDVIDELITNSPEAKVIVLLYEDQDRNVCGIIRAERPLDAITLAAPFGAAGTREEVRLCATNRTLPQIEQELIPYIQKQIA